MAGSVMREIGCISQGAEQPSLVDCAGRKMKVDTDKICWIPWTGTRLLAEAERQASASLPATWTDNPNYPVTPVGTIPGIWWSWYRSPRDTEIDPIVTRAQTLQAINWTCKDLLRSAKNSFLSQIFFSKNIEMISNWALSLRFISLDSLYLYSQ